VDKDVSKEWGIDGSSGYFDGAYQGFISNSYKRLYKNKDFMKFQKSMLKELY
jgi:hypothetical protein